MKQNVLVPPAAIERETGLPLDLIRKWRSRYGYPLAVSENGVTGYTRDQVAQLKLTCRLIDAGFRASQVVGKPMDVLQGYANAVAAASCQESWSEFTQQAIALLSRHDMVGLEEALQNQMDTLGLADFARQIVAPLAVAIGEAWARGELEVHQEHLCSSLLMRMLQAGIHAAKPHGSGPIILLATPPDEHHTLGVLMVQAILAAAGVKTIMLGASVPLPEIPKAAEKCGAAVVALSFSFSFPSRHIVPSLADLRSHLDPAVMIWVGGSGTSVVKDPRIPGVRVFGDLNLPLAELVDPSQGNGEQQTDES